MAIRYLQDARKIAPQAPQIFRSLGAVEAKIPGRELRAIAWYGVYLTVNSNASDAPEVRKEIIRLEVKNQINISALIKSVQYAASQLSGSGLEEEFRDVAWLWARAGDITEALKVVALMEDEIYRSGVRIVIADAQIEDGDIAGAQKTLASAVKAADLVPDVIVDFRSEVQIAIAEAQIRADDIAGARTTLASAQKSAALIQTPLHKVGRQIAIAKAQIAVGDIADARETLASAVKTASIVQTKQVGDTDLKSLAESEIAENQMKAGDVDGAQKTAELIQNAYTKSGAHRTIAAAQARSGDIVGAKRTADLIQDAYDKSSAQSAIAEAQAKAGIANATNATRQSARLPNQPVITVSDWLKKLDDDNNGNGCPLNTGPFLDLAGYLKSLLPSDNPQKVFESLHQAAEKIVTAENVITGMLKQQAGK